VYERRTLHEEPHQPKRLREEARARKAKPLQLTTKAKMLLFIERTLLSSKRKSAYENNASRLHHAASLLANI
jgi:hypothetical protein